jgi:hypothetical protein
VDAEFDLAQWAVRFNHRRNRTLSIPTECRHSRLLSDASGVMAVVRLRGVPWVRLHLDDYLSEGLDSLGLEKAQGFETGIEDPDSLTATERLGDYADYHTRDEDSLGPEYEKNVARYSLESEDPTTAAKSSKS